MTKNSMWYSEKQAKRKKKTPNTDSMFDNELFHFELKIIHL